MLTWTGKPWDEQETETTGTPGFDPLTDYALKPVWRQTKTPPAIYAVVARTGIQRVKPRGHIRPTVAGLARLAGLVAMAALMVGGVFFWLGVLAGWLNNR